MYLITKQFHFKHLFMQRIVTIEVELNAIVLNL